MESTVNKKLDFELLASNKLTNKEVNRDGKHLFLQRLAFHGASALTCNLNETYALQLFQIVQRPHLPGL
jgi:hypothetical protein